MFSFILSKLPDIAEKVVLVIQAFVIFLLTILNFRG